jgi:hypothetical protein
VIVCCRSSTSTMEATRRALNKRFLHDLAEDWQQHGREVFKRVRRESPAAYLKVCAMLVPKEMKVEHTANVIKEWAAACTSLRSCRHWWRPQLLWRRAGSY